MPTERLAMRHVRDVMRLKSAGMSTREIARRVGTAPSTARLTIRRFEAAGLICPLCDDITDSELEARLFASAGAGPGDPETGKRQARPHPVAEWIVQEVPELRIIDDELWNAAKARQVAIKTKRGEASNEGPNSFRDRRRPKYIFSGLIKCAWCGGGYAMISADLIGCSTARNKGTCENRTSIQRDRLEGRVLNALRYHLMDPALFKEFCDEFTREMNRLRMEGSASLETARSELKRIERELDTLLNLILKGGAADRINAKMVQLEGRKAELERQLADAEIPPPLLHPEMATFYREQVSALHETLQDDTEATRLRAGEVLRSLVKEIILTPQAGELRIDVRGDLAGILAISLKTKTPATGTGVSQVEMVAGRRNHRYRHSLAVAI